MNVRPQTLFYRLLESHEARLARYFDDLELEIVIPKLLAYVFDPKICENAVWLTADQFKVMKLRESGVIEGEVEQYTLRHLRLQAFKPLDDVLVAPYLKNFASEVSMSCIHYYADGRADLLCPILHEKTREPLAYILLARVAARKVGRVRARLERDLAIMARHIQFSLRHWEAQRLSYLDDLTGLFNQKFMSMVLENEIYRAQREDLRFSVLFMDVDFFKSINDSRGHLIGSRLLIEVSKILKFNLRRSDYAFRYGGDEFVVVLPVTSSKGAQIAAERIREHIEKTNFVVDGVALKLTLSIGLATFPDHAKTHKDIIKMADEAMYCGKNKSRNIVFVAS